MSNNLFTPSLNQNQHDNLSNQQHNYNHHFNNYIPYNPHQSNGFYNASNYYHQNTNVYDHQTQQPKSILSNPNFQKGVRFSN